MKDIFTAAELAALQLDCLPKARESIIRRAAREEWIKVKESSRGVHGFRFKYQVPEYVQAEISQRDQKKQAIYTPSAPGEVKPFAKDINYNEWLLSLDMSEAVPVIYLKNIFAGMGLGALNTNAIPDFLLFRRSFLNQLGVEPKNALCVKIKGESMYPTLVPDGVGLFDISKNYEGEDIYLIKHVDELKVKRLQMLSTSKIRIISDNKDVYAPVDIDLSNMGNNEFEIIGKYLWHAGIAK